MPVKNKSGNLLKAPRINLFKYIADIKLFEKNVIEVKTLTQEVRIQAQNIWMELVIETFAKIRSGKREITEGVELPNQ